MIADVPFTRSVVSVVSYRLNLIRPDVNMPSESSLVSARMPGSNTIRSTGKRPLQHGGVALELRGVPIRLESCQGCIVDWRTGQRLQQGAGDQQREHHDRVPPPGQLGTTSLRTAEPLNRFELILEDLTPNYQIFRREGSVDVDGHQCRKAVEVPSRATILAQIFDRFDWTAATGRPVRLRLGRVARALASRTLLIHGGIAPRHSSTICLADRAGPPNPGRQT